MSALVGDHDFLMFAISCVYKHLRSATFQPGTCSILYFTIQIPGFFSQNVRPYFKGILFHYYKDFPYICIYCWKGNILENFKLLNKIGLKSRDTMIYSKWLKIYWPNNVACTLSKYNKKTNSHT